MEAISLNEQILDAQRMSFDIAPNISKDLSVMREIVNLMEIEEDVFETDIYIEILKNLIKRIQIFVEEIRLIEEENKALKLKIK
jgi:hypothetical protein